MNIVIKEYAGSFGENKDVAREMREQKIMPALAAGTVVELDFSGVTGATQSFIHALISDAIRTYGEDVWDKLHFVNCSELVQEIINIVADYMQESI